MVECRIMNVLACVRCGMGLSFCASSSSRSFKCARWCSGVRGSSPSIRCTVQCTVPVTSGNRQCRVLDFVVCGDWGPGGTIFYFFIFQLRRDYCACSKGFITILRRTAARGYCFFEPVKRAPTEFHRYYCVALYTISGEKANGRSLLS
jgi:hypothetical protein